MARFYPGDFLNEGEGLRAEGELDGLPDLLRGMAGAADRRHHSDLGEGWDGGRAIIAWWFGTCYFSHTYSIYMHVYVCIHIYT